MIGVHRSIDARWRCTGNSDGRKKLFGQNDAHEQELKGADNSGIPDLFSIPAMIFSLMIIYGRKINPD